MSTVFSTRPPRSAVTFDDPHNEFISPVPRYEWTYHGSMYLTQGAGQASKTEKEQTFGQDNKVHQGCYYGLEMS